MPVASAYSKPLKSKQRVASVTHNIATQSRTLRIPLDRLHFVEEHRIGIRLEQIFTLAAPTSFDEFAVLEKVQVQLKGGNLIDLLGREAINHSRAFGGASLTVFGVNPLTGGHYAQFMLDIHHELNGAIHDLMTGIHSQHLKQFDLVLTFADKIADATGTVNSPCFVGGITNSPLTLSVTVDELYFDALTEDVSVGLMFRKQASTRKIARGGGVQEKWELELGGINRAFMLSFYSVDIAGVLTPNDNILKSLTFKVGDQVKSIDDAFDLKAVAHEKHGGFNSVGTYLMDFGGDDAGWPDLRDGVKATLQVESDGNFLGDWVCMITQDQVVPLEKFNA